MINALRSVRFNIPVFRQVQRLSYGRRDSLGKARGAALGVVPCYLERDQWRRRLGHL